MGLNSFPTKRALLALSASLTLFSSAFAEDTPSTTGTPEQPGAGTGTAAGGTEGKSESTGSTGGAGTAGSSSPESSATTPAHVPEAKADPKKAADLEKGIVEANARSGGERPAARPEERHSALPPTHPAAKQPVHLYGRIEELCAGTGAKIPLKMVAMQPVRDTSYDAPPKLQGKATTLTASAATKNLVQTFPIDYRGSWTGELTINSANFDPSYFQWNPAVAEKEARFMQRGNKGTCTVTFYQGANNKIQAEPSQVLFQGTDTVAGSGGMAELGAMANNPMFANMANMKVPVTLALKLGAPVQSYERGVTGNQLGKELMKNTLKELSPGLLEQDVVTKDSERSSDGRVRIGYSESVLRFTRISSTQLYLQAASVYYNTQAKFQSKIILYGTLNKSYGSAPQYTQNPYGTTTMPNPFGGMMPGGSAGAMPGMPGGAGGAGSMQDAASAIQKMLQQMNGR